MSYLSEKYESTNSDQPALLAHRPELTMSQLKSALSYEELLTLFGDACSDRDGYKKKAVDFAQQVMQHAKEKESLLKERDEARAEVAALRASLASNKTPPRPAQPSSPAPLSARESGRERHEERNSHRHRDDDSSHPKDSHGREHDAAAQQSKKRARDDHKGERYSTVSHKEGHASQYGQFWDSGEKRSPKQDRHRKPVARRYPHERDEGLRKRARTNGAY